jgi:ankyrin repeat protein
MKPMRVLLAAAAALVLTAAAPGDAPVADAAMRGDVEAVRALLKQGADVNAAQGDGMTALHWAAERGSAEIVQLLVRAGATLDPRTRNAGYTPLHLASRGGHVDAVRALLQAKSDPAIATESGAATALHLAAVSGSAPTVQLLLDHGADPNTREAEWGQTPLTFATAMNRLQVMKVLLERGADPSLADRVVDLEAFEAVDTEAKKARDQVLAAFRARAGSPVGWIPTPAEAQAAVRAAVEVQRGSAASSAPAAQEQAPAANAEDVGGFAASVGKWGGLSPLLYAAREGHAEAALLLLGAGADVNQLSAGDHTSPLLMAMINGHFDLGLLLLQRGASPNLAADNGATPLFAVINAQWKPKSRYPQQHADMQQNASYLETMEALLKAGADPNARLERHPWYMEYTFSQLTIDTKGATPFWRAAYGTDVEAMKLLVRYGADPTIPTMKMGGGRRGRGGGGDADPSGLPPVPDGGPGIYPLHAASGVGYGEGYAGNYHRHVPDGWLPAVKYLVEELHADVNARDLNGYSAVHHAAARGDVALIRYLVDKGADVTVVSRRGQTTVDMANGPVQRIQPFPEAIALLESLGAKNNHRCVSC